MSFTFVKLAETRLTSNTATVTFSGISQSYTDLQLVISGKLNNAAQQTGFYIWYNGVNTTTYSDTFMQGAGTAVGSGRETNNVAAITVQTPSNATSPSSIFGNAEVYIPNYANSSNFKTWLASGVTENNSNTAYQNITAGLWRSTAAITSISVSSFGNGDWLTSSSFTLYGISNTI